MKKRLLLIAAASLFLLQACGGGSGDAAASASSSGNPSASTSGGNGSGGSPSATPANGTLASSSLARLMSPSVSAADADALRAGNTAFAADLYATLRNQSAFANRNLFFSPYSISVALAMTYAGARGATASQIQSAMRFTLPDARLHAAFDALDLALTARPPTVKGQVPLTLNIANSMWGEATYTFGQPFLDTLATDYGAGVYRADFRNAPDAARAAINNWVADKTADKIQNLLSPAAITNGTRFVLVNAVYFNGGWSAPFASSDTAAGTFHGVNGDMTAQMMQETAKLFYGAGSGWRAVALPYYGGLTFTAIVPDNLAAFESSFNAATLATIDASMALSQVTLTLPKFKIQGATFSVKDALKTLGATAVFDPKSADLSGIAIPPPPDQYLYISDVLHQAFISVDEKGTEAAAATGAMGMTATAVPDLPSVALVINQPFIFLIRDNATGAVVFLGRYVGG